MRGVASFRKAYEVTSPVNVSQSGCMETSHIANHHIYPVCKRYARYFIWPKGVFKKTSLNHAGKTTCIGKY